MDRAWLVDVVQRLPQGVVSRAWGWLARRQRPRLGVLALKRVFVQAVGVDLSEAKGDMASFNSLEELFVRKLRPGARRIDPEPNVVVSPVDGAVGQGGLVENGTLLQVKGRTYSLATLLGTDDVAARYEGGAYLTLYLAPRDYHRIHAPLSGQVSEGMVIPGGLMPVFTESVQRVDNLFARNERVITYIDTPNAGRVALVKVGATLVGRITLAYDPDVWTNQPGQKKRALHYNPPRLLQKGGEVGTFELGSTVVVVFEPGRVILEPTVQGGLVRMGQCIGHIKATRRKSGATSRASTKDGPSRPTRKSPRRLS